MDRQQKEHLGIFLIKVMDYLEYSYERVLDEYGIESQEAEEHPYSLARDMWAELEIEIEPEGVTGE